MNPRSLDWLQRADAHLATARRELSALDRPHPAATCLHAHLAALACLRACLLAEDVPFPLTTHLVVLLELCLEAHPDWERFRNALRILTQRVPTLDEVEEGATQEEAENALNHAEAFRQAIGEALGA